MEDYVEEILASGFPGLRGLSGRVRRLQLEGYIQRIVDRDIPDEAGVRIRNPTALRRWLTAYAAATAMTASFEKIRDAATAGQERKPSKEAVQNYRDALTRVWVLDEIEAWIPADNPLRQLAQAPSAIGSSIASSSRPDRPPTGAPTASLSCPLRCSVPSGRQFLRPRVRCPRDPPCKAVLRQPLLGSRSHSRTVPARHGGLSVSG